MKIGKTDLLKYHSCDVPTVSTSIGTEGGKMGVPVAEKGKEWGRLTAQGESL